MRSQAISILALSSCFSTGKASPAGRVNYAYSNRASYPTARRNVSLHMNEWNPPASGQWLGYECNSLERVGNITAIWNDAGSDEALQQLFSAWDGLRNDEKGHFGEFAQFVWNTFGMSDSGSHRGACSSLFESADCSTSVLCKDFPAANTPKAAQLIINSLVYQRSWVLSQVAAIDAETTAIEGELPSFASTFTPEIEKKNDVGIQIAEAIIDVIANAVPFGASAAFTATFKAFKLAKVGEKLSGGFGTLVETGVGGSLASLKPGESKEAVSNEDIIGHLRSAVSMYSSGLATAYSDFHGSIVKAETPEARDVLASLYANGGMHQDLYKNDTDGIEYKDWDDMFRKQAEGTLYGKMMQAAWRASPKTFVPFIFRLDNDKHRCGDKMDPGSAYARDLKLAEDQYQTSYWCDHQRNTWYLLSANVEKGDYLKKLDGIEALDGQWGGVTLKDIVISSYSGFRSNNNANGYTAGTSDLFCDDQFDCQPSDGAGLPFQGGMRTPGFFNLDICTDVDAIKRAIDYIHDNGLEKADPHHPICGKNPDQRDYVSPTNTNFASGRCELHFTQTQKDIGDQNKFHAYQLEVRISDNNRKAAGEATKQLADDPLILVDSLLPYRLIVNVPTDHDDDPIEFWHADQYWKSDAKQNGDAPFCKTGGYDNGDREGHCWFNCMTPDKQPHVSATATHPLPSPAEAAIGDGHESFVNTWISAEATPTPPPQMQYRTGECGVHVTQWQRRDDGNAFHDYQLEVSLHEASDGDHSMPIAGSGKVVVKPDVPLDVYAYNEPFKVTTKDGDDYPVYFSFGDQQWDSNKSDGLPNCNTGKYEDGKREMDCGFRC